VEARPTQRSGITLTTMKVKIQLLLLSVGLLPIHVSAQCNIYTGGSCTFFSCQATRHAKCVKNVWGQGTCQCRPGSCAKNGVCHAEKTEKQCLWEGFTLAHTDVDNTHRKSPPYPKHIPECKFRKTTGAEHTYDATAISDSPEVANISFRVPGPYSVRIVGLTTDPNDDDNFEHGGFIKFDERGRVLTPAKGSIQHQHDVYTLKVADPIAQKLEAFINATSLGVMQAPSPIHGKTMYAKMFIQTVGAEIVIMNMEQIRRCAVGHWSEWSHPPVTCGGAIVHRTRKIKTYPVGDDAWVQCPNLKETKPCDGKAAEACPASCVRTDWSCWSPCTATCSGGTRARARALIKEAESGGSCHGSLCETGPCNTQECPPEPCEWSSWSAFSDCSAACGWGEQTRSRHILKPARYGGKPCEGAIVQKQACEDKPCPHLHCSWGDWGTWSHCIRDSNGCHKTRERTLAQLPTYEMPSKNAPYPRPCDDSKQKDNCLDTEKDLELCDEKSCPAKKS